MVSIVDAFENILDIELTPKNASDLNKMDKKRINNLADGCIEFMNQYMQSFETSMSSSIMTESFPCAYIDSRYTDQYYVIGRLLSTSTSIDTVGRFLLYYPAVAINDAFMIKQWEFPEMREYLGRYFSNLATLAPLIKRSIVRLVPFYPGEAHQSINKLAKSLIKELKIPHKKREIDILLSTGGFPHEFSISSYFDSFVPYCSKYEDERPLLLKALKQSNAVSKIIGEIETTVIAKVLPNIQLPKLGQLPIEDILAIREDDETFAQWRSQLQHVITHLHVLAKTGREISSSDFQSLTSPILIEEATRLREKAKNKSSASYIKDSFIGFSIATVSSLVTTGLTSIDWKALAAGSGAGLLYSLIFKQSSKSEKALLKHYALFEGIKE